MATNNDFLKVMVKDTTFHWPRLDQPYRYNSQEKRTEACAPTVANAGYSIAFDMTMAEAKELRKVLSDHYNAARARNSKLPEFSKIFGAVKNEEAGTVRFTAKKRAVSNDGKINAPPKVVGADLKDLEEKGIWSGSKGNLRVLAFPTTDPDGAGGISLLLDVVQVVDAVYGGDNLEDDFGPAQTGKTLSADDDFDTPTQSAPPPVTKSTIPNEAAF
jgi:hypothetical protein